MLALESGGSLLRTGDADTEADLVVGNIVHPFLVEDVLTGNVGGDVTADGVAHVGSTVRVELTTFVTGNETDLGKVTKRHELNVEGSLDKVSTCHGSVGNYTGIVTRLCAVSDGLTLDVADDRTRNLRAKGTPVLNRVEGSETRIGSLVDGRVELRRGRVGGAVPVGALYTRVVGTGSSVTERSDRLGRNTSDEGNKSSSRDSLHDDCMNFVLVVMTKRSGISCSNPKRKERRRKRIALETKERRVSVMVVDGNERGTR